MSVFQLPKTLCQEINSMMARFWWGHKGNEKRVAWMSWERMGKAKEKGVEWGTGTWNALIWHCWLSRDGV
jgi:hypothetical protein